MKQNFYQLLINTYSTKEDYKISTFYKDDLKIDVIFIQGMTDLKFFISYLYDFINSDNIASLHTVIPSFCSPINLHSTDNTSYLLSLGNLILIVSHHSKIYFYHLPLNILPKRTPSDSHLDPSNLFQSRDGLIEDAKDNLLLIKKRIKSPNLNIKRFNLGTNTLTDVYMLYLNNYQNEPYIKEIEEKLLLYHKKDVTSINNISRLFSKNSLVPLTNASGNTEYLVESINKGKVVLIVDGNCVGLILPALFMNFTNTKDESDSPKYFSLFKRILVSVCIFFSIFFLGGFVAVTNYHSNILSLRILALIKLTETGTILPMFFEICVILLCFELYNLAVSKSPLGYVQNIVVLFGGLIIGQNVVSSGIVGPFVLLTSSLCYIAGYSVSNNPRFLVSISIFRFMVLFGSFCFGLLGFFITSIFILCYLYNQKSVGVPYLEPFIPLKIKEALKYYSPEVK